MVLCLLMLSRCIVGVVATTALSSVPSLVLVGKCVCGIKWVPQAYETLNYI